MPSRRLHALRSAPLLVLGFTLGLIPPQAHGATSSAYQFIGGTLNVIYGSGKFPVTGMTDGYILFEDGKKSRRTKSNAVCSLAFKPALAVSFVRVDDLRITYTSRGQMLKTTNSITASLDQLNGIGDIVQDIVSEQRYDDTSLADTADVTASVLPNQTMENVFCAMVVQFDERRLKNGEVLPAGAFVRAEYIGNLTAGEFKDLAIRKTVGTFAVEGARIGLFFFDQSGQPIPTNHSPQLKIVQVDPSQLQRPK